MRKNTHPTIRSAGDATVEPRTSTALRPLAPSSGGPDGGTVTVESWAAGTGMRARRLLVALLAMLAIVAAGVATADASGPSAAAADQSNGDATSHSVAFWLGASTNGATWS